MGWFTEKELKAKARRMADQILRIRDGRGLPSDVLPGDVTAAKLQLRPLYSPADFVVLTAFLDSCLRPPENGSKPDPSTEAPEPVSSGQPVAVRTRGRRTKA